MTKNVSHGGAVYVISCEIEACDANFTNCVSENGRSGIYVKISKNLVNHIYLKTSICIYSSYEANNITISNCIFVSNEASGRSTVSDNEFFGGGTVYYI